MLAAVAVGLVAAAAVVRVVGRETSSVLQILGGGGIKIVSGISKPTAAAVGEMAVGAVVVSPSVEVNDAAKAAQSPGPTSPLIMAASKV